MNTPLGPNGITLLGHLAHDKETSVMSHTNEATRPARKEKAPVANETAPQAGQTNGEAPAGTEPQTVTITIADLQVTLPVKFLPGHVLTDNQAKVLDAAYQRQFTNNQNANATSRKAALEKLGDKATDADRAKYAPRTAAELAADYVDYEPSVGGGPRLGSMEKMRHDATWSAWVQLVTEHNAAVASGA